MKYLVKLEEAVLFFFSVYAFSRLDFAWWLYPALLFTPDLSMVGYLAGPKAGAWTYNIIHHKAVGLLLFILGTGFASQSLQLAGLILFGHSSMDRVFGYGLKYSDSFQHTHLGIIGKNNKQ